MSDQPEVPVVHSVNVTVVIAIDGEVTTRHADATTPGNPELLAGGMARSVAKDAENGVFRLKWAREDAEYLALRDAR